MKLRHEINLRHPVFGEGYRKLEDGEVLEEGDETANVSRLLTPEGDKWVSVIPEWQDAIGKTIGFICDCTGDMDGSERVFRRRIG